MIQIRNPLRMDNAGPVRGLPAGPDGPTLLERDRPGMCDEPSRESGEPMSPVAGMPSGGSVQQLSTLEDYRKKRRTRLEWSDISVFLQVARSGQMAGASRLLGIDHSTISRRIARLEEDAGVALFDRAGRRLSLTDEGVRLLAAAERLEAIVIRDVLSLGDRPREISGKVRVGATEGFGSHYLARRIPNILAQHPNLEIELIATPRRFSLGNREADIVISLDRPQCGDIRLKKLCDMTMKIYATEAFLRGRPKPRSVQDLRDDLWCGYLDEMLFAEVLDTMTFGGTHISARYRTTSVTAQLEAVLSGSAVAVLPPFVAQRYPALVPILPSGLDEDVTYWMSIHNDLARSPRVRAVMDAIERIVHADRDLFLPND